MSDNLISKQKVLDILEPRLKSAVYVCDNLCRHSHNNDLTQDELDEICDKCKVTEWVRKTSDQKPKIPYQKPKIPYQKPEILSQSDSADSVTCRNFIRGRFMGIK